MTSGSSKGKEPLSPGTLNMIFTSKDFSKLMQSKDTVSNGNASNGNGTTASAFNSMDLSKMFGSTDSAAAAALFRSADFLKSLESYKESMAATKGDNGGSDATNPADSFKSVDFLKSLDTIDAGKVAAANTTTGASQHLVASPAKSSAHPNANNNNNKSSLYTSQDWMEGYEPSHVDVSYNKSFFQSGDGSKGAAAVGAPPKMPARAPAAQSESVSKWMQLYEEGLGSPPATVATPAAAPVTTAKANNAWDGVYDSILSNPMQAPALVLPPLVGATSDNMPMPMLGAASAIVPASVASAPAVKLQAAATSKSKSTAKTTTNTKSGKPKKKRIYKSRKIIPEVKNFVDFTDDDVLLGRGGLSNKHPGNKRYRQEIENAKAVYRTASKDEKTQWASLLVEYVEKYGGRFLERDKATGNWYIVPDIVARRKAGQALREDNTAESRAEKRDRYKKSHGLSSNGTP